LGPNETAAIAIQPLAAFGRKEGLYQMVSWFRIWSSAFLSIFLCGEAFAQPPEYGTYALPWDTPELEEALRLEKAGVTDQLEFQTVAKGYDSVLGELKTASCVELVQGTPNLGPPTPAPQTEYRLTQIKDASSFASATQMTASAAYSWGTGKVDSRANYLFSRKLTAYRSYTLQDVDITYPEQVHDYGNFRLSKLGKAILRLPGGLELFRYTCGDSFVIGFARGGRFSAIVSVSATTQEEQTATENAVAASVGQGQITGALKALYESKQTSAQLSVEIIRSALEEALPSVNIQALIDYAQQFPHKLGQAKARPIRYLKTADYTAMLLKEVKKSPIPTPEWAKLLEAQFVYLRTLARYRSDLVYIRDSKQQFVSFDERPLAARI